MVFLGTPQPGCNGTRPAGAQAGEDAGTCTGQGRGEGQEAWAQRPGETERAYGWFRQYLGLGRRRCYRMLVEHWRVTGEEGPAEPALRKLGGLHQWRERAAAWDVAQPPVGLDPERQAWEQQPGEPDPAYAIFRRYLALGVKRTYRAALAAELLENPRAYCLGTVNEMGRAWRWRERALRWDAAFPEQYGPADANPWDQRPGEPDLWYGRFERFLALGAARTVGLAARREQEANPHAVGVSAYHHNALRWQWRGRAEAWDLWRQGAAAGAGVALPTGESANDPASDPASDPAGAPASDPASDPADGERRAWDILPEEPAQAYGVFCHYLELGPGRTLRRAVREALQTEGEKWFRVSWYGVARRWHWEERAAAWDTYQRDRVADATLDRFVAGFERRLALAEVNYDGLADALATALDAANFDDLDEQAARKLLPMLHGLVAENARMQRAEVTFADKVLGGDKAKAEPNDLEALPDEFPYVVNADTLSAYCKAHPQEHVPTEREVRRDRFVGQPLLVCTGPAPIFGPEPGQIAAVTKFDVQVVEASLGGIEGALAAHGKAGRVVEFVHLALPLVGEMDAAAEMRLCKALKAVELVVVTGCDGIAAPAWLRLAPWVITLAAGMRPQAAYTFVDRLWESLADGDDPDFAFKLAVMGVEPRQRTLVNGCRNLLARSGIAIG